ncbi:MAG: hypothetical protein E7451_01105 [Ruminococcaceae bacterium]|nr:hypothetical protein [Oscillospiraceae bacterium]
MINSQRVLNDIIKTSQLGINGINIVMSKTDQPALRQALKVQRREYSDIEQQAKLLAQQKGYRIDQLKPINRKMGALMSKSQLLVGEPDSKIAGMMIQGNTRGMILSLKNMRRCNDPDPQVAELAQKLLETEKHNIVSMEGFL